MAFEFFGSSEIPQTPQPQEKKLRFRLTLNDDPAPKYLDNESSVRNYVSAFLIAKLRNSNGTPVRINMSTMWVTDDEYTKIRKDEYIGPR